MAILSKKKDTIRVESVNTDPTVKEIDFLGINPSQKTLNKIKAILESDKEQEAESSNIIFKCKEDDSQDMSNEEYLDNVRNKVQRGESFDESAIKIQQ